MYDLLKKLNTLVSAQVNDLTSRLPTFERKPDLDRQVAELRERVASALEHEDRLRAQVAALQQEIAGLDARVDAAIQAGHEVQARTLLEEIQRLQKRLSLAEADLRQHQSAAADLIIRVNELEAAVGDLKAAQPPQTSAAPANAEGPVTQYMPPKTSETQETQPAPAQDQAGQQSERKPWDQPRTAKEAAEWAREDAEKDLSRANTGFEHVGGMLRDIQARVSQRIGDLDRMLQEGGLTEDSPASAAPKPKSGSPDKPSDKPDDDLSDRLSRLSKPE